MAAASSEDSNSIIKLAYKEKIPVSAMRFLS